MKKSLKNASLLAIGLVLGMTASSLASQEKISAVKDNLTSVFILGEQLNSSQEENMPINYNNRLYVPLRVVSEKMDLDVKFEKSSKAVYISQKVDTKTKKETCPEKKVEKKEKKVKDNTYTPAKGKEKKLSATTQEEARKAEAAKKEYDYKRLPVYFRKDKFFMDLTMVVKENAQNHSEFYFDVKNDNAMGMNVDALSAKFTYYDKYKTSEIDSEEVRIDDMDKRVLSSIDTSYDDTLYFTLNEIPSEVKEGVLTFNISPVTLGIGEKEEYTKVIMPIKLD